MRSMLRLVGAFIGPATIRAFALAFAFAGPIWAAVLEWLGGLPGWTHEAGWAAVLAVFCAGGLYDLVTAARSRRRA
jgi:hypothetical protein